MSHVYGDYDPTADGDPGRFVPEGVRRLIGAVLFVGLVALIGLWAYRLGTRDAAEVPIIRALEGPVRVEPDDPGGLRAAHQGLEVNAVLAGEPAAPPEATAPLAPAPSPLAAEDGPQGELVLDAPVLAPETPAPEADLGLPFPDEGPAVSAEAVADTPPVVSPTTIAALVEAAVEPRPASEAATADDGRPLRRPANLARAAAPAAVPAPAAAREVAGVAEGARLVQLGVFDGEAVARDAWRRLVADHGDLLGERSLYLERADADGRVFHRLRVAGFEGADETRALCEALRARSVDCIPVTRQ